MTPANKAEKEGPKLYFAEAQQVTTDSDEDMGRGMVAAQLVRKGDILATLPRQTQHYAAGEPTGKKEAKSQYELVAGANTEPAPDPLSVTAVTSGYPSISEKITGDKHLVTVSVTPFLTISDDKMRANVTLYPPIKGHDALKLDSILDMLEEEGVVYGIDTATIKEKLETLNAEGRVRLDIIAARGILPLHGKDAYFRFEVEIGPIAGKLLRNGKIDFRDRKAFVAIEQNQLIATKVPATTGTPGKNVLGENIPARPGNDSTLSTSGDVDFIPETREIRAKSSGILSIVNDNNIQVSAKQVINGDIDYSTGNIESKNAVEITGSVLPGFNVSARGDIAVAGNVQAAQVVSKANIIVKGGLVGENSHIKAKGDVDISFIEKGNIEAGGLVVIRKQSYYSKILAAGSIHCSEQSRIVGGALVSGESITCGDVGAPNAKAATLAAGVSGSRYGLFSMLQRKEAELEGRLSEYRQRHGAKALQQPKFKKTAQELEEIQSKLKKLNLLPGTAEYSRMEPMMNSCPAEISVFGDIIAGTTVRIGNVSMPLPSDCTASTFMLDDSNLRIRTIPLKQRG